MYVHPIPSASLLVRPPWLHSHQNEQNLILVLGIDSCQQFVSLIFFIILHITLTTRVKQNVYCLDEDGIEPCRIEPVVAELRQAETSQVELSQTKQNGGVPVNESTQPLTDGRKGAVKVPWTSEELQIVKVFFKAHIKSKTLPTQKLILAAQERYPLLRKRKWLSIRSKVRYIYMVKKNSCPE